MKDQASVQTQTTGCGPGSSELAFELHPGESVSRGAKRIVRAQLAEADERLRSGDELGEVVHGARKNFKRIRSTLRLVAGPLDADLCRREGAVIRDLAKQLSGARDSQVMLETFSELTQQGGVAADTFRAHLTTRQECAQRDLQAHHKRLEQVTGVLHDAELRVATWDFAGGCKTQRLRPALRRIYSRGRKDFRRARNAPTAEHLHDWRKRTKDLWYAAQILHQLAPKRLEKLARRAHHLADLLGDLHDLAVLREEIVARADPGERQRLLELIDHRSDALQGQAFAAGKQLYRRNDAKFGQRMR